MKTWPAQRGARIVALAILLVGSITTRLNSSVWLDATGWDPSEPCTTVIVAHLVEEGGGSWCPQGGQDWAHATTDYITVNLCPGDYYEFIDSFNSDKTTWDDGCEWSWFNNSSYW